MGLESFEVNLCRQCKNSNADLSILKEKIIDIASKSEHKARMSHERIKVGISACPNACSSPQIKDFGVMAVRYPELIFERCTSCKKCFDSCKENAIYFNGFPEFNEKCIGCGDCFRACNSNAISGKVVLRVMAGGRLGRHPRFAEEIGVFDSFEDVLKVFEKVIEISERYGKRFSHVENCNDLLKSELGMDL